MKKSFFHFLFVSSFLCITAFSQQTDSIDGKKKNKICAVNITFQNDQTVKYVLSHFSNDSLYAFPVVENNRKKEIQVNRRTGIKAEKIKKIYVYMDKKIFLPDSLDQFESQMKMDDDSLSTSLRKINTKNRLTYSAIEFPFDPITGLLTLGIGLLIGRKGTMFYIEGKEKKFLKMVKKLSGKRNQSSENTNQ